MMKLGFLGLGIMGSGMAANLLKAGFGVTVWNRNAAKCQPLVDAGATQAATPADVAAASDITFAMLADPAAALEVALGPFGVVEGMGPGKGYVDMSTVDVPTTVSIAAAVNEAGGKFLEAPVSGTKKPAIDGTLIILAGGDHELYEQALPALEKMGKKVVFLGETGNGARMKLVVNMVMGGMMAIFCEGVALSDRCGLQKTDLFDVLAAGALANPMFQIKGNMIANGDYATSFPLKHMQKDLRLALALGDELSQPLASAAAANSAFIRARQQGWADEDFVALFKAISGS